jgi:DEAD/DEAH box helicase domain-containing protein
MIKDARRVATRFLSAGMQTIVFCRSRGRVEILTSYLKRAMAKLRQSPDRVRGYRGGYLPAERRAIERGIKSGDILGVVSTNALEMGIDIGQLRVCVMAGYPGTIASAWQQSGRAGRSSMPAVVVMVGSSAPLDQYLLAHPEYFFGTSPEQAIINPENVSILANHIKCAAFELPFQQGETFGPHDPTPVLEYLQSEGLVRQSGERFHWSENAYPAEDVSLRSPSPSNFLVKDITRQNKTIAEVDYWGAAPMLHTEAIYIHDGKTYHVDKLDWDRRMAFVQPIKTQYYTDAVEKTDIRVLDIEHETLASDETQAAADASVAWWPVAARRFGEITVQTVIAKYKKVLFDSHESIGHGDVYVPMQEMQTECYWLTFSDDLMTRGRTELGDPTAALFGLANILNNVLPLLVMCAPRDVRTVAMVKATHDNKPAIYIYDNYPGGIGLVRRAFAQEKQLLQMAEKLVTGCRCPDGCPSCVGPVLEIGRGGKAAVVKLLKLLQTAK